MELKCFAAWTYKIEAFNDAEKFDIKYFSETHSDLKFYSDDNTCYLGGYKLICTNHPKNIMQQWKIKTVKNYSKTVKNYSNKKRVESVCCLIVSVY